MAFECPHCGFKNNEVQSGQAIADKGVVATCAIRTARASRPLPCQQEGVTSSDSLSNDQQDLNRQIVKSEFATVRIPELDLEIPPTSRNGNLTTVEGTLQKVIDGLAAEQSIRQVGADSPVARACEPDLISCSPPAAAHGPRELREDPILPRQAHRLQGARHAVLGRAAGPLRQQLHREPVSLPLPLQRPSLQMG